MARRWKELEIETMLDYREKGMTEEKIAAKLNLVFMTKKFTKASVNRKIRDLKNQGYLERNERTGRYTAPSGVKRDGENYEKNRQKMRNKGGRPRKNFKHLRKDLRPWDGYNN